MKLFISVLLLFFSISYCAGQVYKNIDYGYINASWTYINEGFKIQFTLPKDWHFFDASKNQYVKVGSDIKNIPAYTRSFQVPMANFKKSNSDRIATLFEVSKIGSKEIFQKQPFDDKADKTITVGVVYSENPDVYAFLKSTCLRCTDQSFKEIYLKSTKLGNIIFEGYITGVTDNKGNKMGHFFGARRMGNIYLICQYNFPDLEAFESYKEFFKTLALK